MIPSQTNDFTFWRCGKKPQEAPCACWEQLTCSCASVIVGAVSTGREIVIGEWLGIGIDAISGAAREIAADTKPIAPASEPGGSVQQILSVRHAQLGVGREFPCRCLTDKTLFVSENIETKPMPEISRFFGIIIRMFYDDHDPPHLHAEYSGKKAVFDFRGNIVKGNLGSRTATKLVREWIDIHISELEEDWQLARNSEELNKIQPLT